MSRTALTLLGALVAFGVPPLTVLAQSASGSDVLDRVLNDVRGGDLAMWTDVSHRRDRIDAVPGCPEFSAQEAAIRSSLDAGQAEGWLDRNDFLIFGRQLHQTELLEARELRLHGETLSDTDRNLIRGELDELRVQLADTRARTDMTQAQR